MRLLGFRTPIPEGYFRMLTASSLQAPVLDAPVYDAPDTVVLDWSDLSTIEDGVHVYASYSEIDINALPPPAATLAPNTVQYGYEFDAGEPLEERLYFRVAAFKSGIVKASNEVSIGNPANVLYPDSPTWLFGNEEYGFANTLGLDTLFTDTSGTTPVSAYGDAIALAGNLADDGPDMVQATGAERLVWGRAPVVGGVISVRNELVGSDALSTQSVTVTAAQRTLSFRGTGTVTLSGASTAGPLVGTGADDIVSLTFTPTAGSLTLTVSGDVLDAQLELGASRSNYQSVGAGSYDIAEAGAGSVNIAYMDTSDDNWSWTLPAGTYHLFIAGEKGCYFATVTHAGGEFTVGPTTWTGGPAGAVTSLIGQRHVIMPVIRDEAFTQFEKAQLVAYAMARGCPTLYTKSANLWTGEDLSVGTGWTDNGDGTYTSVGPGSGQPSIQQPIAEEEIPANALYITDYTISRTLGAHRAEVVRPSIRAMTPDSTASGRMYQVSAMTSSHGITPNRLMIRNASGTLDGTVSNVGFYRIDAIPLN